MNSKKPSIYQSEIFLDQLFNDGSPLYNIGYYWKIVGKINLPIMQDSIEHVLHHHQPLREQFAMHEGKIVRRGSCAQVENEIKIIDCSKKKFCVEDFEKKKSENEAQSFALHNAPLTAVSIFLYAEQVTLIIFKAHHLVADARSLQMIENDIISEYNARLAGQASPLTSEQASYEDFVKDSEDYRNSTQFTNDIDFWREELALPVDQLFDNNRTTQVLALPNQRNSALISAQDYHAVGNWCKENGVTIFQYFTAIVAAYLSQALGKNAIAIGMPILNRRAKYKNSVGLFSNILRAVIEVKPDVSLIDLVRQVSKKLLAIFRRQRLPFGELVRLAHETGHRNALFDIKLSYEQYECDVDFHGTKTVRGFFSNHSQNNALSIAIRELEQDGQFEFSFDYVLELLGDKIDFPTLRDGILQCFISAYKLPEQLIKDISLVSAEQKTWLLDQFNDTEHQYDLDRNLAQIFYQQVDQTPDQIALSFNEIHMSYRELDQRSNQVAQYLLGRGVSAEELIGVRCMRSFDLLIAIFGVIKAGCAYVPIDPAYPPERVESIVKDADCRIILTGADLTALPDSRSPISAKLPTELMVTLQSKQILNASIERPRIKIEPDQLAYVLYTSGSTGKPKGVMVQHRGVINRILWQQERYPIGVEDCLLHKTPYAFDVSVWELFWWTFTGSRLAILPPAAEKRPDLILAALLENRVSAVHFVPSMLGGFLDYLAAEKYTAGLPSLRYVICSGEALTISHVKRFFAQFPLEEANIQLINLYGPTEASIDVSYFDCQPQHAEQLASIPIGKPIHNTSLFVLNKNGQLVAKGMIGELHIAGLQLARGYKNLPEMTREKFFYHEGLQMRLYRTGDLARINAQGEIEYFGRIDNQVKIRGNRIEIGEIEYAYLQHAAIREAVVSVFEYENEATLCAHYVSDNQIATTEIRAHLAKFLPEYMIPVQHIWLESFPLNANGKLDRRALPPPDTAVVVQSAARKNYAAASDELEAQLVKLFEEVLNKKPIGVQDNYFQLGGDSLKIIKIHALAREQGLSVSLAEIYQHPTIAELAAYLKTVNPGDVPPSNMQHVQAFALLPEQERAHYAERFDDAFPASQLQVGMIYHSMMNPESAVYHDIFRYRVRLQWHAEHWARAWHILIARHSALRLSFDIAAKPPIVRIQKTVVAPIKVMSLLDVDKSEHRKTINRYLLERKRHRYQLLQAPLYEIGCFILADEIELVFSFQHASLDGWSVATMMQELFNLYQAQFEEQEMPAPAVIQTSLADFIQAEQAAIDSPKHREFWKNYLQAAPTSTLAHWAPALAHDSVPHRSYWQQIPSAVTEKVDQFCARHNLPQKSVLMAAHCYTQALLSAQDEVICGVISNGRPEFADAESLLGLFLNTLPLRFQVKDQTWLEMVKMVLGEELSLYPHRRYPLMLIQKENHISFSVAFNYTNFYALKDALEEHANKPYAATILDWEPIESTNFDLLTTLGRHPINGALFMKLDYSTARVPTAQVECYTRFFVEILSNIAEHENAKVSIPKLFYSPANVAQALQPRNLAQLLHSAFAEYADKTAISLDGKALTYQQLAHASAEFAVWLQQNGVAHGARVALLMPRSIELMVAVFGILQAGAAYIPVDLSYPSERIKMMLEDSAPDLCLFVDETQSTLETLEFTGLMENFCRLHLSQSGDENALRQQVLAMADSIAPEHNAYILFTSGSTGRPKGVAMPHRALVNLIEWQRADTPFVMQSKTLQYAPISFDVSFQEIFSTIRMGGELVLIQEAWRYDLIHLLRHIEKERVERLFLPYAALQQLAEIAIELKIHPASLKLITVAGEQLKVTEDVRNFFAHLNHCVLENHYGPTEAHVVTRYRLSGSPFSWPSLPPIGTAIANTTIHILNTEMGAQPIGMVGDIYLEGDCLANGYWQAPDLTANSFVQLTINGRPRRVYKTGDIGYFLPKGDIVYLGRADSQVKIRGYRIELGEIEVAMMRANLENAHIQHAAVIDKVDGSGQCYLVGFVQPTSGHHIDIDKLRGLLRAELPDYMLPSQLISITDMPIGPTGKVDRKKLQQIELEVVSKREIVAPRTELEEQLLALWRDCLQLSEISIFDNFFEVGGNSLNAVRVVAILEKELGVQLPLSQFIQAPTIAEFAKTIGLAKSGTQQLGSLVNFNTSEEGPALFLVHPIGGNILCYAGLARALKDKMRLFALQAPGVWDSRDPINSVEGLAACYADEIIACQPEGDLHIGGWSFGGFVAFELSQALTARGRRVKQTFLLDSIVLRKRENVEVSKNQLLNWFMWELLAGDWQTGHKVETFDFDQLDDEEVFSEIKSRAVAYNVIHPAVSESTIKKMFAVFEANWIALLSYELKSNPHPLTIFAADGELPTVLLDPHQLVQSAHQDACRGWSHVCQNLTRVSIPGDHLTMMMAPNIDEVGAYIVDKVLAG